MYDSLVDSMEPGVLRTLFKIFGGFVKICTNIVPMMDMTLRQIFTAFLEQIVEAPEWLVDFIDFLLSSDAAFVYNIALGELILGSILILVLAYGIVEFFTDIVL